MDPFYLKYEPRSWDQLALPKVDQALLRNWIVRDQLPRVVCLFGAPGTGKTSIAKLLIQSKLCLSRELTSCQPCGKCAICTHEPSQYNSLTGVHWISPVGGTDGETELRAVKAALTAIQTPSIIGEQERAHVFVVLEEAQNLRADTFSKFLYVGDVKSTYDKLTIIVLSMNSDKIEPTTRDALMRRGMVINLPEPTSEDITNYLSKRLPIPQEVAELVASCAKNYGEALSLCQKVADVYRTETETIEDVLTELDASLVAYALHAVPLETRLYIWEQLKDNKRKSIVDAFKTKQEQTRDNSVSNADPNKLLQQLLEDIEEACINVDITASDIALFVELARDYESKAMFFNLQTLLMRLSGTSLAAAVTDYLSDKLASYS